MPLLMNDGTNHWERKVQEGLESGTIFNIHRGVYIEATAATLPAEVHKNWNALAAAIVPDGVLTDRTAMEGVPTRDPKTGFLHVFVAADRAENIFRLPGLVINMRQGTGPHADDPLYIRIPMASLPRRLLDNLTPSRARSGPARTVGRAGVEAALDKHAAVNGLTSLLSVLGDAERIAPEIGREKELAALTDIITGLTESRPEKLRTAGAKSRSRGVPEDARFLTLFSATLRNLSEHRVPDVADAENTWEQLREACFMDAYFSNFIEGTQFLMDEARDIVLERRPTNRMKDGHDIQATFELLLNQPKASVCAMGFEAFLEDMRRQHAVLMRGRPEVDPGMFKTVNNRVGDHRFVEPEAVIGTMRRAWDVLGTVRAPFARALGLHYLVSGVHPFNDGNGRMSRLLMTQELRAHGLCRIVAPTISRQSYIAGLRNISDRADVFTFVRSMETFQRITAACVSGDQKESHRLWASTYAFCEDDKRANLTPPSLNRPLREFGGLLAPVDYWASTSHPLITAFNT